MKGERAWAQLAETVSNLEICLEDKDDEHDADDEEHVLQPQKLNIPAGTLGLHHLCQAQRSVSCAWVCAWLDDRWGGQTTATVAEEEGGGEGGKTWLS